MLESIFIEIINSNTKNLIVGCMYCHPCMELSEFNNDFFTYLCQKLLRQKNKEIVLMGDFNVDLPYCAPPPRIKGDGGGVGIWKF